MDKRTKGQRRKNMQAVKNKDSKIEIMLGKALWKKGYRYRKNDKTVFGKPDFFLKSIKLQYFAIVSFGTIKIGKKESMTARLTLSFGIKRLKEISRETRKPMKN